MTKQNENNFIKKRTTSHPKFDWKDLNGAFIVIRYACKFKTMGLKYIQVSFSRPACSNLRDDRRQRWLCAN